ncbi:MAG: ABC transporter ATP-binding protein [Bacteroidota bacterium]
MNIYLENIGKKYSYHWIFRSINAEFAGPGHYGILGSNGSGKSTLLKILSGFLTPSAGKVIWEHENKDVSENIFHHCGIASPHLELIEEFTLAESIRFHGKFRSFLNGYNENTLVKLSGLGKSAHKPLKYFSSGMKQRVKLLLAVMSDQPLVILDEPCSNLDENSIGWYQQLIKEFAGNRLLIVGSNDQQTECFSCTGFINLSTAKL